MEERPQLTRQPAGRRVPAGGRVGRHVAHGRPDVLLQLCDGAIVRDVVVVVEDDVVGARRRRSLLLVVVVVVPVVRVLVLGPCAVGVGRVQRGRS